MNYSVIRPLDIANGPGIRVSLFVSGCSRRCKGCFNPETWNFEYGQKFTSEKFLELYRMLGNPNVKGLSILGGDPFEPANRECVETICALVALYFHGKKDIWVWTGYTFEEVKDCPAMKYIDVLVDGPFEEDKKDLRLKWRGSSNQRVIDVQESLRTGEVILYGE